MKQTNELCDNRLGNYEASLVYPARDGKPTIDTTVIDAVPSYIPFFPWEGPFFKDSNIVPADLLQHLWLGFEHDRVSLTWFGHRFERIVHGDTEFTTLKWVSGPTGKPVLTRPEHGCVDISVIYLPFTVKISQYTRLSSWGYDPKTFEAVIPEWTQGDVCEEI